MVEPADIKLKAKNNCVQVPNSATKFIPLRNVYKYIDMAYKEGKNSELGELLTKVAPQTGALLAREPITIIYKHNKPYGIRDKGGYLFFFTDIRKYDGQEDRYRKEVEQQYKLADFLLAQLSK